MPGAVSYDYIPETIGPNNNFGVCPNVSSVDLIRVCNFEAFRNSTCLPGPKSLKAPSCFFNESVYFSAQCIALY